MTDKPVIRVFISSPGDVDEERRRAALVLRRLKHDYARFFDISPVLWEYEPMLASGGSFQDIIIEPAVTDIVVVILWSRLGTHLPERTAVRDYRGLDGRAPITGTEWEFENALAASRERMARAEPPSPHILVYKKSAQSVARGSRSIDLQTAAQQMAALESFWMRHFENPEGELLLAYKGFTSEDQFEHLFEANIRSLLDDRIISKTDRSIIWPGDPYLGLRAFEFDHARIFFGRGKAVRDVVGTLVRRAESGLAFMLVTGASGSGKSSFVQAGVVPSLYEPGVVQNVGVWRRCFFRLSGEGSVLKRFAIALTGDTALPELIGIGVEPAQLVRELASGDMSSLKLALAEASRKTAADTGTTVKAGRLVLVIDQLEELFTDPNISPEMCHEVAALLGRLAASSSVWTIATMRSDFFGKLSTVDVLRNLTAGDGLYHLAPPRPEEIDAIIRQPAEASGLAFEIDEVSGVGLEQELREAASGHPHALPLLQFTLHELYRRDVVESEGRFFRFSTYREDIKGLEGAIAARAEALCEALPQESRNDLLHVLTALVTLDDDGRPVGKPAPLAFLSRTPGQAKVIDIFVDARLLAVFGPHPASMVSVAHEALITHWPRFATIIGRDNRFIEDRDRLSAQAELWHARPDKSRLLASGLPLEEGKELLKRRPELEPATLRFIDASIKADVEAQCRRRRILASVLGGAIGLAAIFAFLAKTAYDNSKRAQRNFEVATAALSSVVENVPDRIAPLAPLSVSGALLESASRAIEKLPTEDGAAPVIRLYQADIYLALGTLSFDLAKYDAARVHAARVDKLFGRDDDVEAKVRSARSQHLLGKTWHEAGDGTMAKDDKRAAGAYRKAIDGLNQVLERTPPIDQRRPQWALVLAQVREDYGELLLNQVDQPDVQARVIAAKEQFQACRDARENSPLAQDEAVQHDIGWIINKMADAELAVGNKVKALLLYREARDLMDRLNWASNMRWQHHLGILNNNIGLQYKARAEWSSALDFFKRAVTLAESLAARDPDNAEAKSVLAWSHDNSGDTFARWARAEVKSEYIAEAEKMFDKAEHGRSDLSRSKAQWKNDLAITQANIAALRGLKLAFAQNFGGAALEYDKAAKGMAELKSVTGHDEFDLRTLELREWAGDAYLKAGQTVSARQQWEDGLRIPNAKRSSEFDAIRVRISDRLSRLGNLP